MSEDNGFVERPVKIIGGPNAQTVKLIATAENGKAIVWPVPSLGASSQTLKRRGFKGHISRQPDGTYLAWCERIEPVKAP